MRDRLAEVGDRASPQTLEDTARIAARLRAEVVRRVIGQRAVVEEVLTVFVAGGHCLLRGVPGLAKTFLIETLARRFV